MPFRSSASIAESIPPGLVDGTEMSFVTVAANFGCIYGAAATAAANCSSLTFLPFVPPMHASKAVFCSICTDTMSHRCADRDR
jgi:hypothetical protein